MTPRPILLTQLGQALGCMDPICICGHLKSQHARGIGECDFCRASGCGAFYPALGCPASRPDTPATRCSSEPGRGQRARAARRTDEPELPEECYYAGDLADLGPAPAPHVHAALSWGYMDREASELAAQSREDLIRFFQMKARIARRGPKARGPQLVKGATA